MINLYLYNSALYGCQLSFALQSMHFLGKSFYKFAKHTTPKIHKTPLRSVKAFREEHVQKMWDMKYVCMIRVIWPVGVFQCLCGFLWRYVLNAQACSFQMFQHSQPSTKKAFTTASTVLYCMHILPVGYPKITAHTFPNALSINDPFWALMPFTNIT